MSIVTNRHLWSQIHDSDLQLGTKGDCKPGLLWISPAVTMTYPVRLVSLCFFFFFEKVCGLSLVVLLIGGTTFLCNKW